MSDSESSSSVYSSDTHESPRFGGIPFSSVDHPDEEAASVDSQSYVREDAVADTADAMPIVDLTELRNKVQDYLAPLLEGHFHQILLEIECGAVLQISKEESDDQTSFVQVLVILKNIKSVAAMKRHPDATAAALHAHKQHTKSGVSHLFGLKIESQSRDQKQLVLHESEFAAVDQPDMHKEILNATKTLLKYEKGTVLSKKTDVVTLPALEKAVDNAFHWIFMHMLKHRTSHFELLVDNQHKPAFATAISHRDLHVIEQGDVLAPLFGAADLSIFLPVVPADVKSVLIMLEKNHSAIEKPLKTASRTTFGAYDSTFQKIFPNSKKEE